MLMYPVGDVTTDHMVKMLRFLHSKGTISSFVVNKSLGEDNF